MFGCGCRGSQRVRWHLAMRLRVFSMAWLYVASGVCYLLVADAGSVPATGKFGSWHSE